MRTTDPTFEFGLDAAINNDPPYLVPFRVRDLTTGFLRDGIHYSDLSDQQKRQLEEDLGEEEARRTTIAGKDIGRRIFSESTDRIILENLINNGIKDDTGSLVGKTIVLPSARTTPSTWKRSSPSSTRSTAHGCARLSTTTSRMWNPDQGVQEAGQRFRIAISVDMLDTGIDVPEVVNLVFAKPVKSWVKFWQ